MSAPSETGASCASCGSRDLTPFYGVRGIPVHSCLVMPDRRSALAYRKGDLQLAICPSCGFVQNTSFDASLHEYSTRYEETQSFSPRFNRFATELATRLLDRFGLRGKTVLEIGCGKGEFLCLLCELGGCRGIGFDPGYRPERTTSPAQSRIRFVQDFWSEKYADVAADRIGTVTLKSVGTTRPDEPFGVTAGVSLGGLRVATPAFLYSPKGPVSQGLNLDQDADLEFLVRVG